MYINYKHIIKITIGIAVLMTLLVAEAQSNAVKADVYDRIEDALANNSIQDASANTSTQDAPQISEKLEATGTHFELNNTSYLNITLDSSEPIKLALESIPEMVTMHIESASDATSTQINLSGFAPETTYHIYEDNYHNHVVFITDANGSYTYTQDISRKHLVFIQPRSSTIFINDNATGGDCARIPIGTWNAATMTCKLSTNLTETIQIDNDSITLDGDWHTSNGLNTGSGIYLAGRIGVTVKNMNIKRFSYGIYLYDSSSSALIGNNASNNGYGGGISLASSSNNTLSSNTASNNNNGISLASSSNNTLGSNTMTGNSYNFKLDGETDSHFDNNIDPTNLADGKSIYHVKGAKNTVYDSSINAATFYCIDCVNVTIKDMNLNKNVAGVFFWNTTSSRILNVNASNNYYGIYLKSSSNNTLSSNTASSNDFGIYLKSSNNNTLSSNNASSNTYYGISLESSSNSALTTNTASSNRYDGIYLKSSSNNTLSGNNALNNIHDGLSLKSSSNNTLSSNTASSNGYYNTASNIRYGGITLGYSSNNALTNNAASNNRYEGISLGYSSNNTLSSNTMTGNSYNFGLRGENDAHFDNTVDTTNLADGKSIYHVKGAKNTVYDSSINAATFYCINCVNVTIKDMNLNKNDAGVFFWNTTSSRILNINASNNDYSIYLWSSSNNTLSGNTVSNNNNGISLYDSSSSTLSGNTVSNNYYGISLESSSNNTLSGNTVSNNIFYGISLWSSSNNTLSGNTASNNNNGISLESSSNNTLSGNIASNNRYDGLSLGYSSNNTLSSNIASDNNYGIYLYDSNSNKLNNNTASNNRYDGLYLVYSSNNTLGSNTMTGNSYNFRLDGETDSHFDNNIDPTNLADGKSIYHVKGAKNTVYDSSINAATFYCINCVNVTIKDMNLNKNVAGVFFWNTTSSRILNVNASNNNNGLSLIYSSNNMLSGNTASNNNNGLSLDSSSNNNLTNNSANSNSCGIYFGSSSNNSLTNNSASLNDLYGIYLDSSSNNNMTNNIAADNSWDFFSTGNSLNTDTNLWLGSTIVSFESKDVAIKNSSAPIIAGSTGKPGIEIHVAASNNDGSNQTVGISDGTMGNRDINSFGPAAANFAGARSYTFDAAGNPVETIVPLSIETLSSPATENLNDDEVGAPIALPFPVNMYGRANNYIRISSNGFIFLNNDPPSSTDNGCCRGQDLKLQGVTSGDDFLISGTWNDLYPPGSGSITYGTEGTAPDRIFIIYFNNISNCCNSNGGYTFQIKLFENSTFTKSDPAPIGFQNIGKFIKATRNSAESWLFLNMSYTDSDVKGVNETLLRIWKSDGLWSQVPGTNGVNTAQNYVYANTTGFGVFAPMGRQSVESITGKGTVYFATDAGIIKNLTAANVSDIPQVSPDGMNFYYGMFRFNITGLSPGGSANLTLTFQDYITIETTYWKYGNTSTNSTPHWYSIPSILNGTSLTMRVTDGGIGDDDLTANGNIVSANTTVSVDVMLIQPGWNLISVPFNLSNKMPFAGTSVVDVRYYNASMGQIMSGMDMQIEPLKAYWVNNSANASISVQLSRSASPSGVDGSGVPFQSIPLVSGWNMIGYTGKNLTTPSTTMLGSLGGDFWNVADYNRMTDRYDFYFNTGMPHVSALTMRQNAGYWVYATRSDLRYAGDGSIV